LQASSCKCPEFATENDCFAAGPFNDAFTSDNLRRTYGGAMMAAIRHFEHFEADQGKRS